MKAPGSEKPSGTPSHSGRLYDLYKLFDHDFFRARYRERLSDQNLDNPAVAFSTYLRSVSADRLDPNPDFSETSYLHAHPDVREAVENGGLICGFQHWVLYGRSEKRETVPASTPSSWNADERDGDNAAAENSSDSDYSAMLELFDGTYFRTESPFKFVVNADAAANGLFDLYLLNIGGQPLRHFQVRLHSRLFVRS